jgi:hypothetical protein
MFGPERIPTTPLSFDRVMEGQPPTSKAVLFTVPYEILSEILQYIDRPSLAALALVSKDCRQLARPAQFSSIVLDYSRNSYRVLVALCKEGKQRDSLLNRGLNPSPFLGACIRQIILLPDPRPDQNFRDKYGPETWRTLGPPVNLERERFYIVYDDMLSHVLYNRDVLPHLELVSWESLHRVGHKLLSSEALNEATSSAIQHLNMDMIILENELEFDTFSTPSPWSLRTLNMGMDWSRISSSPFCSNLLRSCAHSLETLVWKSARGSYDPQSFGS